MTRGFLLSLDALFALSLILLGLSFFALHDSVDVSAGSALFLAGRDYLASGRTLDSDLLRRGWSPESQPPASSMVAVRSEAFVYPTLCTGLVPSNAPCLNASDASIQPSASLVWVSSG